MTRTPPPPPPLVNDAFPEGPGVSWKCGVEYLVMSILFCPSPHFSAGTSVVVVVVEVITVVVVVDDVDDIGGVCVLAVEIDVSRLVVVYDDVEVDVVPGVVSDIG